MGLDTLETFPADAERRSLGSLGRASLVYALGGFAYKAIALISIPLLARLLSPAELGLLDFAALLASLIGILAVAGSDQAVAYFEPRVADAGELWGSALVVVGLAGGALAVVSIVAQGPLAGLLTGDPLNGPTIASAGVYGLVVASTATVLNAIRLRGTPVAYAFASFAIVTLEMTGALLVAVGDLGGVALMVLGWAIGAVIILVPAAARYMPRPRWPGMKTVRGVVAFGGPLVPMAVAWLAADAATRAVLAQAAGLDALGQYGIAYRIASALGLVVTGFGVAWYPHLFRRSDQSVTETASRALVVVIPALAGIGAGLIATAPETIALIAGSEYLGGRAAVPSLVGGMVGLGVFVLLGAVVGTRGSTTPLGLTALAGGLIQIAGSVTLVPALGVAGAGLASLLGYVAAALALAYRQRVVVPLTPPLAVAIGAATTALVLATIAADASIGVRLVVAAAAGVALWRVARWSISRS